MPIYLDVARRDGPSPVDEADPIEGYSPDLAIGRGQFSDLCFELNLDHPDDLGAFPADQMLPRLDDYVLRESGRPEGEQDRELLEISTELAEAIRGRVAEGIDLSGLEIQSLDTSMDIPDEDWEDDIDS